MSLAWETSLSGGRPGPTGGGRYYYGVSQGERERERGEGEIATPSTVVAQQLVAESYSGRNLGRKGPIFFFGGGEGEECPPFLLHCLLRISLL